MSISESNFKPLDTVRLSWTGLMKPGLIPTEALTYDVIILYRLPMGPALEGLINQARQLNKPVIFDTDDLIFEPEMTAWHRAVKSLSPADQVQHLDGVRRYLLTLLACDVVTVATPFLAELADKREKAAFVHRNALGNEMLNLADELYHERRMRLLSIRRLSSATGAERRLMISIFLK